MLMGVMALFKWRCGCEKGVRRFRKALFTGVQTSGWCQVIHLLLAQLVLIVYSAS
jgi:hypothetical protein